MPTSVAMQGVRGNRPAETAEFQIHTILCLEYYAVVVLAERMSLFE